MASSDNQTAPGGFEDGFDAGAAGLAEEILRGVGSSPLRALLRDPVLSDSIAARGATSAALVVLLLREAVQRLVERRRGLAGRRAATA